MRDPHVILNGVALAAPCARRPYATLRNILVAAMAAPAEWLRTESEIRRLSFMDDHMLRDIGISRSQISRVVRKGRE